MTDAGQAEGLPAQLSAFDLLMHRGEANPRMRSGILSVEILEITPPWDRFVSTFDIASRRALRLRQKVVVPLVPTAAPRWIVDPDFSLAYHVRRVRCPEPGTLREVLDLAEVSLQSPLDISRPLWTVTLVEGLTGGQSAVLLHVSHAVTDGIGSVELFSALYDLEPKPAVREAPALPLPQDLSAVELAREGLSQLPGAIIGGLRAAVFSATHVVVRAARDPMSAANDIAEYARSATRVIAPGAAPSPLLARRSLSTRSEAVDVGLAELRAAAKAVGGSINDAYLAGLCGALYRYHEALGVPVERLPMAVPVNVRADADPAGGNRFAGINLAAPVGAVEPRARIHDIQDQMRRGRKESAIGMMAFVAPVLSLLPMPVLESMIESITASDVQASNVPMHTAQTYLAGAKVLRQYGLGPLPGVAMMAVLVSRARSCTVTVRYDQASVTDEALFAQCLLEGFNEVLTLSGDAAARTVPASFNVPR
ncbi:wax ester/triacylglycerol synthase family O-acyltransferase [Mycobacterium avium]|uniref:wax ester/triacylglycerol synthase family O-acyltransferase n=1 Tax=Mycobacterium avium TaxID=1764 RepID=UPI000A045AB7|nr:wax ester/triacylglycerol synthase family O-acyltransferase [Mycobacterium avium]